MLIMHKRLPCPYVSLQSPHSFEVCELPKYNSISEKSKCLKENGFHFVFCTLENVRKLWNEMKILIYVLSILHEVNIKLTQYMLVCVVHYALFFLLISSYHNHFYQVWDCLFLNNLYCSKWYSCCRI